MTAPVLEPTAGNVRRAAERIREGGVVVAPSDTNLALTLDPWNPEAVHRAYEIKDRPAHKPLTLFVRNPADWRQFGTHDRPEIVDALVGTFWPGPLNLVLRSTERVTSDRLRRDGTVSIGCLSNPTWRDLAAAVDGPLAMTSANLSGTVDDDTLVDIDLAREHVGNDVDCILAGGPQGTSRASTIVDLTVAEEERAVTGDDHRDPSALFEVLRRGDLSAAEVAAALASEES